MVTPRQHEAVFPVVQVQALVSEGVALLPAENAQTGTTEASEVKPQAALDDAPVTVLPLLRGGLSSREGPGGLDGLSVKEPRKRLHRFGVSDKSAYDLFRF